MDLAVRRSVEPVQELVVSSHSSSCTWVLAFPTWPKTEAATAVTPSGVPPRAHEGVPAMLTEDPDDDASRPGLTPWTILEQRRKGARPVINRSASYLRHERMMGPSRC